MKDNNSITTFIAGAAIGAVLGVLFAPDKGEQTRRKVRAAAKEGRDFVKDTCSSAAEKAQSARADITELRDLLSEEGQALKESVRERLYAKLDRLEKAFDAQVEDYEDELEDEDEGEDDEENGDDARSDADAAVEEIK